MPLWRVSSGRGSMHEYSSRRIAIISSVVALIVFWYCAPAAYAQASGSGINGVYNGTYMCAMERNVKLSLFATPNGVLTAMFTFYPTPGQASTFSLNGTYDAATQKFTLQPSKWETPTPPGFSMVGMDGTLTPAGSQITGKIVFAGCYGFQATKDEAASANIGAVMAQQRAGAASPNPGTTPAA